MKKQLTCLSSQVEKYTLLKLTNKNALTIHYTKNTEEINLGDMVLVDAGGVGTIGDKS